MHLSQNSRVLDIGSGLGGPARIRAETYGCHVTGLDLLQGEDGDVLFPVPWAREFSISHLATPDDMRALLDAAGFRILAVHDSTDESQAWFEAMTARMAASGPPPLTFQDILGSDFVDMARHQVRNLTERRIRTVTYICEA